MNIFGKRPLSLILCVMLGAFSIFAFYDILVIRIALFSVLVVSFAITFIPQIKEKINKILVRVCMLIGIFSMLLSFLYFDLWFYADERYEGEVTIEAEVINLTEGAYNTALLLDCDNVNESLFSGYKLIAYVKNDSYDIKPGDTVIIKGEIDGFTQDKNFDAKGYYSSRGISGIINDVNELKITGNNGYPISKRISDFRELICNRIINLSDRDVGGLLCALLLGEKDLLPTGTKLDFSRIGISHILALSGMHLAILAIGFSNLLERFRVSKKPRTICTIAFTVLYMTLTGFSVSVTRAGIMLLISSLLYLLAQSRDSFTSLFISVTLICIFEPYAIFDTSLWLSAFATLGIVVMSEYQSEKYHKKTFLRWAFTSLLSSFFAISSTFAITTLKFDGASLLSPITTLVFSLLTELFIYIGIVLLLIGSLMPIKGILTPIGECIISLAEWFSSFDWAYVSTNFIIVEILSLVFSLLFFGVLIAKVKHKRIAFSSLAITLGLIFVFSTILTSNKKNEDAIYYSTADTFIIKKDSETCLIDVESYRGDTAYVVYAMLAEENVTKIDKYVLTHYSYGLSEAISTLYESMLIDEIYLPTPNTDDETDIYDDIVELFKKRDTKVMAYNTENAIKISDATIVPLHRYELGSTKKNMLTILYNDKVYTYLAPSMLNGKEKSMALEIMSGSHTIILGRHESTSSKFNFTYRFDQVESLIISSNRIRMHPDTIEYYEGRLFSAEGLVNITR